MEKEVAAQNIQSVGLSLQILEQLAASPFQHGITELSRALGVSKWRIYRHIHTLRQLGYVIQDHNTERFELGTAFYALTRAIPRRFQFMDFARPAMRKLQEKIGHTVVVAALINGKMVVTDTASNGAHDPLEIAHGKPHDLHASAHGKVALAFGPAQLADDLFEGPLLPRYTAQTITDTARLRRVVAQVRAKGWASAFEEGPRKGMNTIAAPLISGTGTLEGSLGFIVPGVAKAIRPRLFEGDIEALKEAARRISSRLPAPERE